YPALTWTGPADRISARPPSALPPSTRSEPPAPISSAPLEESVTAGPPKGETVMSPVALIACRPDETLPVRNRLPIWLIARGPSPARPGPGTVRVGDALLKDRPPPRPVPPFRVATWFMPMRLMLPLAVTDSAPAWIAEPGPSVIVRPGVSVDMTTLPSVR